MVAEKKDSFMQTTESDFNPDFTLDQQLCVCCLACLILISDLECGDG